MEIDIIKSQMEILKRNTEDDVADLLELERDTFCNLLKYSPSIREELSENINKSKKIRNILAVRLAKLDQLEMEIKTELERKR